MPLAKRRKQNESILFCNDNKENNEINQNYEKSQNMTNDNFPCIGDNSKQKSQKKLKKLRRLSEIDSLTLLLDSQNPDSISNNAKKKRKTTQVLLWFFVSFFLFFFIFIDIIV